MGIGRYFCVALPFILTVASIICMLIAGLTGVTSTDLYLFRIDVSNLTVDVSTLAQIAGASDQISDQISDQLSQIGSRQSSIDWDDASSVEELTNGAVSTEDVQSLLDSLDSIESLNGITASDLGLGKYYDINLWGYCATYQDDSRNCTKAQFNWAEGRFSDNSSVLGQLENIDGMNETVIPQVIDGLEAFEKLNKWTEVVFILAMIGLGLELVIGLFSACSRAVSCVTWLISGIATLFVVAAAAMLTVMATVAVSTIESAGSDQGASANYNKTFLAVTWLGAAFAIAASSFWLFSVCCCKPEHRPHSRKSDPGDGEKLIPTGSYQPIGETQQPGYNYGVPQRGGARSDLAYEPYSHSRT